MLVVLTAILINQLAAIHRIKRDDGLRTFETGIKKRVNATAVKRNVGSLCPSGENHIVRKIDQISVGMNASSMEIKAAIKGLTHSLAVPAAWSIEPIPGGTQKEEHFAMSFMLGGMTIVFRRPYRQGIGFAPCKNSKNTTNALLSKQVAVRARRDLQWSFVINEWFNKSTPAIYICREPSCRPFGANELLPERRIFSDDKVYTRREFLEQYESASDTDWKKGTVVPYTKSEEIRKATKNPARLFKASNQGSLGLLLAKEVIINYDPAQMDLDSLVSLAAEQTVFPLPGSPQKETLNCADGCRWTFSSGPDLILKPKEFPAGGKRAAVQAMVWQTHDINKVTMILTRHGLMGKKVTNPGYQKCVQLSLAKYGITSLSGMWFCPRHAAGSTAAQQDKNIAEGGTDDNGLGEAREV
eukprot:TRINITY_DN2596_c2_g1_i1.p1 TRINITY_DN2596_c2_g1~~TRINITY_DN2596_c2_g1_i1.p1  ORF type:complete len:430 (+),score=68.51 TRINITY_DN2596_c2_g1_i1:52-1290(+)